MTNIVETNRGETVCFRPAKGTMQGDVYDALRSGEIVTGGDVGSVSEFNMVTRLVGRHRSDRGGMVSYFKLVGEWHEDEFYPLHRVHEINATDFYATAADGDDVHS